MFARRKKEEGFEWHRYVRTTIKLRREQRRQRLLEARQAAAGHMGAAGAALAQGLAQGSRAAGAAARDGARAGLWATGLLVQGLWHGLAAAAVVARQHLEHLARPLIGALARPNVGGPIAFAGAIALGSGIGRCRSNGLDGEAAVTLVIGTLLLAMALPMLPAVTGLSLRPLRALATAVGTRTIVIAAAIGIVGLGWLVRSAGPPLAGVGSQLPLVGGAAVKGRASAVSGDQLRIGAQTVRLAGIEAPERTQRCGTVGRGWRCGAAAEAALGRLIKGRLIQCTLSGSDGVGPPRATCLSGETDVGAELVRRGHVFAESGFFSSYASLEREARNARLGIWRDGEAERPAAFRTRSGKRSGLGRRAPSISQS